MRPLYVEACQSGRISEVIDKLYEMLKSCELCPRKCRVNRLNGEKGFCRSIDKLIVSSAGPHFGEEPELVGRYGSGTIFLTNCNLGCIFCQNYEISHLGIGEEVSIEELARMMIRLQNMRCHNINFVTPTHFTPQIIKAVKVAYEYGLRIPLVYNCGGYENVEVIKLLDGIIDIYMPDMKYSDSENSKKYSKADDYFERCKESIKEMHRQVGDLKVGNGIAYKGLLVRHLVMPNDIAGSEKILKFLAEEISKDTYVNIMDQYRPCYKAKEHPAINRRIHLSEYNSVIDLAKSFGLHRGFEKRFLLIF